MTESKDKRHKQVCHCLLNICEHVVNSITEKASFKLALLSKRARQTINPIQVEPPPNSQSFLSPSLPFHFSKSLQSTQRSLSLALSLSPKSTALVRITDLSTKPYLVSWRALANQAPTPDLRHRGGTQASQPRLLVVRFGEFPAPRALQSGTGFEILPPLAISSSVFQFLKGLNLNSVGLGLESVPFQFGWNLVEWNPNLEKNPVDLGLKLDEYIEIYDEVKEEQPEVCGPQIELDLGTGSSIHDLGEPPIEAVEEVHEVVDIGDTSEEGECDVEMRTADMPVPRVEAGDSFFEDYLGDAFEKVGEINLEETPHASSEPVFTVPSGETSTTGEPRRKRTKTLAGRTNLP